MPLEPFLLAYAGLASLAASTSKMRGGLRWSLPDAMVMKILGGSMLAAAFWRAMVRFGPYQGPVAWTGLLCLSGALLVLLASRWKAEAVGLAVPALLLAAGSMAFVP